MSNYSVIPRGKTLIQILNANGDYGEYMLACPINLLDEDKWLIGEKLGERVYNPRPIYDETTTPKTLLFSKGWYEVTETLPGVYEWRKPVDSESESIMIEFPNLDIEEVTSKYLNIDYIGYRFFQTSTTYNVDSTVKRQKGWYEVAEVTPATTPKTYEWTPVSDNGEYIKILDNENLNTLKESGMFSVNSNCTNIPLNGLAGVLENEDDGAGRCIQRFTIVSNGANSDTNDFTYTRTRIGNAWSTWVSETKIPMWKSQEYPRGSWVEYRGKIYRAKKKNNVTPTTSTVYWEEVSLQTLRDSEIQLIPNEKDDNVVKWKNCSYITNSDINYLATIHCVDPQRKIISKKIVNNVLEVEFDEEVDLKDVVLKLELQNAFEVEDV